MVGFSALAASFSIAQEPPIAADDSLTAPLPEAFVPGKSEEGEASATQSSKPLLQSDLFLPSDKTTPNLSRHLGGGLFPPDLWPLAGILDPVYAVEPVPSSIAASLPDIKQKATSALGKTFADSWNLLSAAEAQVWEKFFTSYAPSKEDPVALHCQLIPQSLPAADLAKLSADEKPAVSVWITPGPEGSLTIVPNQAFATDYAGELPKLEGQQFPQSKLHWLDQAKIRLYSLTKTLKQLPPPQPAPAANRAVEEPSTNPARWLLPSGLGVLVAVGCGIALRSRKKSSVQAQPPLESAPQLEAAVASPEYLGFPEVSVQPRLGGSSGGGCQGYMEF
jgi:hypothetical protein